MICPTLSAVLDAARKTAATDPNRHPYKPVRVESLRAALAAYDAERGAVDDVRNADATDHVADAGKLVGDPIAAGAWLITRDRFELGLAVLAIIAADQSAAKAMAKAGIDLMTMNPRECAELRGDEISDEDAVEGLDLDGARATIAALEAENTMLRTALKPFADANDYWPPQITDDRPFFDENGSGAGISLGDLRGAGAALKESSNG